MSNETPTTKSKEAIRIDNIAEERNAYKESPDGGYMWMQGFQAGYWFERPTTHPQGEPKTDEEIDLRGIMESCCHEVKLFPTNTQFESIEKGFKEYGDLRCASERAQIIAEKEQEIGLLTIDRDHQKILREACEKALEDRDAIPVPRCLQECKISFDRKLELSTNQQYSSSKTFVADLVEAEILQKFSLLLSQAKGLPTKKTSIDAKQEFLSQYSDKDLSLRLGFEYGFNQCFEWFNPIASLLLLQRDEAHKAEVERFIEHLDLDSTQIWINNKVRVDGFVDFKAFYAGFLKEKEGRND